MYFTHLLLAAFPSESKRTASILPDHIVNRFNLSPKALLRAADAGGYEFAPSQRFFHALERRWRRILNATYLFQRINARLRRLQSEAEIPRTAKSSSQICVAQCC